MKLNGSSKHAKHVVQKNAFEQAEIFEKDELLPEAADLTVEEIDRAIADVQPEDPDYYGLNKEVERELEQAKSMVENAEEEGEPAEESDDTNGSEDAGNDDNGGDDGNDDDNGGDDSPDEQDDDDDEGDEPKLTPEEIEAEIAAYQLVKRKKRKKRLIIALSVLGVIIAAAVVLWLIFVKAPKVNKNAGPITYPNSNSETAQTSTATPDKTNTGSTAEQTGTQTPDDNSGEEPDSATGRKKNVFTFLIVGNDNGYGNTDTIMVGMLDIPNSKLNVVSIPRDTMVNKSWEVKKVNTIYTFDGGIDGLKRGIAELIGYDVDSYCVVDLDAFVALVDAIGGVDYNVRQDMKYSAPDQGLYIDIKAGMQHLNGEDSLKVVRFRADYAGGDIDRIKIQHDFLKAVVKKCLSISSVFKIDDFADIFKKYVDTDLTTGNIIWYVQQLMNLKEGDITFLTVPENYNDSVRGLSYCTIYLDEWLEVINEYINPFNVEITADNLNVITRDSNRNLYATTGAIAGGIGSFFDWNAHYGPSAQEKEPEKTEESTPPVPVTTEDPGPTEPATPPEIGGETGEEPAVPPETGGETTVPPETGGETQTGGETETTPEEGNTEPGGGETPPAPPDAPAEPEPEAEGEG